MNKVILSLAAAAMIVFASCDSTPKATEVKGQDAKQVEQKDAAGAYTVDAATSTIGWIGSKPTGDQHNGTIGIKEGKLTVDANKALNGGSFIIDMTTIKVLDITDSGKNVALVAHLAGTTPEADKKDHFFNIEKFPTGKFEITAVKVADSADKKELKDATHVISGNLELKGISKNISFPAKVNVTDNSIEAISEMNIDRTEWGINFMADESIKDNFINKKINLKLDIKAKK